MEKEKLQQKIQELENQLHEEQKRQNRLAQSAVNRKVSRPEQKL